MEPPPKARGEKMSETSADNREVRDLFPVDSNDVERLRSRLVEVAEEQGLLDVAYRVVSTPIGPLLIAATEDGLVRVAFELEDFDAVLHELATKISPRVLHAPRRLDGVAAELDEYFAGRRHQFEIPLDHRL